MRMNDGELNMMLDRVSSNFEEVTNKFANDNETLQKHIKENKEEKDQNKTDAIQRAILPPPYLHLPQPSSMQ